MKAGWDAGTRSRNGQPYRRRKSRPVCEERTPQKHRRRGDKARRTPWKDSRAPMAPAQLGPIRAFPAIAWSLLSVACCLLLVTHKAHVVASVLQSSEATPGDCWGASRRKADASRGRLVWSLRRSPTSAGVGRSNRLLPATDMNTAPHRHRLSATPAATAIGVIRGPSLDCNPPTDQHANDVVSSCLHQILEPAHVDTAYNEACTREPAKCTASVEKSVGGRPHTRDPPSD